MHGYLPVYPRLKCTGFHFSYCMKKTLVTLCPTMLMLLRTLSYWKRSCGMLVSHSLCGWWPEPNKSRGWSRLMVLQIPFTVAVHSYLWGHASYCQLRGRFLSVLVCSWGSLFVTVLFLFSESLSLTHCFFYFSSSKVILQSFCQMSDRCTFSCMACSRGKLHRILPENFDPSQKFHWKQGELAAAHFKEFATKL